MALRHHLPEGVLPEQVRAALTAVMRRMTEAPGTFDAKGWLNVGFCGHQPSLAEPYVTTGSQYNCALVFPALGLPSTDPFWSNPAKPWTSQKMWGGQDMPARSRTGLNPATIPTALFHHSFQAFSSLAGTIHMTSRTSGRHATGSRVLPPVSYCVAVLLAAFVFALAADAAETTDKASQPKLTIALLQMESKADDQDANLRIADDYCRQAAQRARISHSCRRCGTSAMPIIPARRATTSTSGWPKPSRATAITCGISPRWRKSWRWQSW